MGIDVVREDVCGEGEQKRAVFGRGQNVKKLYVEGELFFKGSISLDNYET